MEIITIFVIAENPEGKNGFYWGSEYGYKFSAKNPQACLWDESRFFDLTIT